MDTLQISTELRAGRSGIESRWGRDFPPVHTGPGAHPTSCKMGTGSFPGANCGRGVLLTTHPLLVSQSWKSRAIPLPPSGPHRACNRITLPFIFLPYKSEILTVVLLRSNSTGMWRRVNGRIFIDFSRIVLLLFSSNRRINTNRGTF